MDPTAALAQRRAMAQAMMAQPQMSPMGPMGIMAGGAMQPGVGNERPRAPGITPVRASNGITDGPQAFEQWMSGQMAHPGKFDQDTFRKWMMGQQQNAIINDIAQRNAGNGGW